MSEKFSEFVEETTPALTDVVVGLSGCNSPKSLYKKGSKYASAWNFGPSIEDTQPVSALVERLSQKFDSQTSWQIDDGEHPPFRITIDFFVKGVPSREIDGWRVVRPETLLTFYGNIHSSGSCFAVKAASRLLEQGIDPVGREELTQIPATKGR